MTAHDYSGTSQGRTEHDRFPWFRTNRDLARQRTSLVENTFDALWDLAKAARARLPTPHPSAITGSVGKTGTKELSDQSVWRHLETLSGTQGNLNNHFWLCPLTLSQAPSRRPSTPSWKWA